MAAPEGWRVVAFKDLADLPSGQVDPRRSPYSEWPLVAPNHIESGSGRLLEIQTAGEQGAKSGKYLFEPGDVIYSKIRPYLQKATLATMRGLCSADMYPLRARADVDPGYLLALLLSPHFTEFVSSVSMRTGIPKINRKELSEYQTQVPPLPEQRKIATILSSVDEAIEATQAVIDQVQVVKKGLMQELLTKGLPGRHKKFKQTEIGQIPEGWEVVELNDLIDQERPICYGILKPGRGHPGGVPVVKVKDIKDGRINETNLLLTTPELDHQYRRSRLAAGDILLTIRGTTGRLAVVPESLQDANITQDTARIAVLPDHSRDFIRYALESPILQHQIAKNTIGQAVKGINIGAVRKLLMPTPPREEQDKIAQIFRTIDDRLETAAIELGARRKVKSGLVSVLLTGELRVRPEAAG